MSPESKPAEEKFIKPLPRSKDGQVLQALEAFIGPDVDRRITGLNQLVSIDAHRRSPVVASIIASRVGESDLSLRTAIVEATFSVLNPNRERELPAENVRLWVRSALGEMRRRDIHGLLQIVEASQENLDPVCGVLNACSFSGSTLIQILTDRKVDIGIRVAAAKAIGRIGFLEAEPALQRVLHRYNNQSIEQRGGEGESDPDSIVLRNAIEDALEALGYEPE
jgi:hypothetical protein